ncbi:MAG: hypothetical protein PARBA_03367 [Parabacteroides sp.]
MRYIISVLLLLFTHQVIAQEWSTYQYQDKYSITIPSTIELRRENDIYTQLLSDIQGKTIGFQVTSTNNNRVIFQQAGLSTNKHEYKTKYCRILIDYYTCKDEHVPCSGDNLKLDEEYFTNGVIAIYQDCESTKTPLMDIISNDTMTIANSPATEIIYRRQGYNGASPVIVAIYTIFNYNEYVRLTMSFRDAEQDIWMKDLIKARNSFRWIKQYHTSNIDNISKDEAVKEGLKLGVKTVWKVILEVIFGCCFLVFISSRKKEEKVKTSDSVSEMSIDIPNESLCVKQDVVHRTTVKKLFKITKKLLLSFIIIVYSCIICGQMKDLYYELNLLFYCLFYLVVGVYYLYLVWKKEKVQSEDILLYPLLKKIGIYSNISDCYLLRKSLLFSVVPLLLVTVSMSLLVVSIDSISPEDYGEVSIGSFILSLPVIAWIVFFVYVYGKKWLDNTPKL